MKAQNLTVSVPCDKCDKDCPYCISTITWTPDSNIKLMSANLPKVKRTANQSGVTSVLITSKKEPFMNYGKMLWLCEHFKDYWLEVQTNGKHLNKFADECARDLYRNGVNVIAFSIDELSDIDKYSKTFTILAKYGIITRICINLTRMITKNYGFYSIMEKIIQYKDGNGIPLIRQVLFRNINYPSTAFEGHKTVKWINDNVSRVDYMTLVDQMKRADLKEIRTIPHTGTVIYSYKSVSVCFSDYCIQESNKTEDIRSLIFQGDGHLYTSWDDPASIIG
jgi:hypothetical protein